MLNRNSLSRRTALKGLGVSLAMPWLDAMRPGRAALAAEAVSSGAPKRMAFLFVPNGINLAHWTPKQTGFGYDLPSTLAPLANVKDDMLVLSGLTQDKGRANGDGPGDHARAASAYLTGAQPRKTDGADIRVGVSVDQVAAQHIGTQTKFASLELGCERGRGAGNCDSGYSCAYSSNISWASETQPMGKEVNPRAVFDRLFGEGTSKQQDESQQRRIALRKSILDFVADDAQRLHAQLGRNDRRKLDEYLTGVREIERRMELASQSTESDATIGFRGPNDVPNDYGEHLRLMCDMLVLAFQTDSTRVATFMFANAGSNRSYQQVEVPDGHHALSHHGSNPEKLEKLRRINQFHTEQLAYMLNKMKSIPEGDGTLLDNSMIVYGSGLSDGNRHNNEDLPILLVGGGGGTIDTGRHVVYEQETPLNNLFLSMLDRMGAPVDYLGDSTGRLAGLTL
ncbi:MAG: DUF1552 domain-containing protein [Planctomycetaceae bacterium]|nr:DUF1552 domain-containing protein [Planctomycetaceae bacterium]